jgi:hypothetical protein
MITIAEASSGIAKTISNFGIEITGQDANVIVYAITLIISLYIIKYAANKVIGIASGIIIFMTILYFFSNETNKKTIHDLLNIETIKEQLNKKNFDKATKKASEVIDKVKDIKLEDIKEKSNQAIKVIKNIDGNTLNNTVNTIEENSPEILKEHLKHVEKETLKIIKENKSLNNK